MEIINHSNIFYVKDISIIGGVETFVYELAKKYKDYDIAVVYKTAHPNQLKRLRKYCKTYRHTNQKINCKVAVINYDTSIIDFINEEAKIYQTIHADYENAAYKWKPPTHKRINNYIAITKHIEESYKRITGLENVMLSYNPLTIEKSNKLVLVSATRLSRIKGKDRMIALANELDRQHIDYIWYIFTNDKNEIPNPNVVYMTPRLDIGHWMDHCDYVVQLSDTEGLSYTINEALYRNKPVIVTPLPYLDEIGVKDGLNAYIMDFECKNVKDIVSKIKKIPKFEFKQLKDKYNLLLDKTPSHYEQDLNKLVQARALKSYTDIELGCFIQKGHLLPEKITMERAEELREHPKGALIEVVEDDT